jgi:hemolysin-activating ACP:hemolysin acyltransferase
MTQIQTIARPASAPALRLVRPTPAAALGLAVAHLMTRPAFARLPFGAWSRILVGQANRGHFRLAMDEIDRVTGFLGWALVSETEGDRWRAGGRVAADGADGDCILFNAWSAEAPAVNRLLLAAARQAMAGKRFGYFRRCYPDGRVRAMKMPVNAFVGARLAQTQ